MDTIWLLGNVYPAGFKINASVPSISYASDDGTLNGTIEPVIEESEIRVRWTLEKYNPDTQFAIYRHSERIVTAMADVVALPLGTAAFVVLDRWIDAEGQETTLNLAEPAVAGLMTSMSTPKGLNDVFQLLTGEQELLLVLRDLVASLASQDHKAINCARCVEAVRHLIAGYDLEPKKQWEVLRGNLNLEAPYLKLITDNSTDHRHGKQTPIDPTVVTEIMVRTWTIIDRFFHFRISGDQKLDAVRFPVLTGP